MKIKEIITPGPHCISPETSLIEAAAKMKVLDIGWLPVCDHDRLVGILTDRDITIRSVAKGYDPNITTVNQAMSHDIVYCLDEQDIEDAARIMERHQVRRLPVLDENRRLVGIVSLGDLAVRTGEEHRAGRILERVSEPVRHVMGTR